VIIPLPLIVLILRASALDQVEEESPRRELADLVDLEI